MVNLGVEDEMLTLKEQSLWALKEGGVRKESEQEPGCSLGEKFFRPEDCLLYKPTGKIASQPGQIKSGH